MKNTIKSLIDRIDIRYRKRTILRKLRKTTDNCGWCRLGHDDPDEGDVWYRKDRLAAETLEAEGKIEIGYRSGDFTSPNLGYMPPGESIVIVMRLKQKRPFTGTCMIQEKTADGVSCGRCMYATYGGMCPRHGTKLR